MPRQVRTANHHTEAQEATVSKQNPYPHGIDITAPGGIQSLIEFHRGTFGDARMEAGEGEGGEGGEGGGSNGSGTGGEGGNGGPAGSGEGAGSSGTPNGSQGGAGGAGSGTPPWGSDEEFDAAKAWTLIQNLRNDKATATTNAQAAAQAAATAAAEKATQDLTQSMGKALGLVEDADSKDPVKLLEAAETELGTLRSTNENLTSSERQAKIHLAVFQNAGKAKGNPSALLDSNSFTSTVKDLDPASDDFGTQVVSAIEAAVEQNPTLKQAQAAASQGGGDISGSGSKGAQLTREEFAALSAPDRLQAHKDGRINSLVNTGK